MLLQHPHAPSYIELEKSKVIEKKRVAMRFCFAVHLPPLELVFQKSLADILVVSLLLLLVTPLVTFWLTHRRPHLCHLNSIRFRFLVLAVSTILYIVPGYSVNVLSGMRSTERHRHR